MTLETDPWVEVRPDVQGGTPVVRGTRIPLTTVLRYLQAGYSPAEICAELPTLTPGAVVAVQDYAGSQPEHGRQRVAAG